MTVVPDMTKSQRKGEQQVRDEAARRNTQLTEEDRNKNLKWLVVGKRGEKRLIKGVERDGQAGRQERYHGPQTGWNPQIRVNTGRLPDRGQNQNQNWRPDRRSGNQYWRPEQSISGNGGGYSGGNTHNGNSGNDHTRQHGAGPNGDGGGNGYHNGGGSGNSGLGNTGYTGFGNSGTGGNNNKINYNNSGDGGNYHQSASGNHGYGGGNGNGGGGSNSNSNYNNSGYSSGNGNGGGRDNGPGGWLRPTELEARSRDEEPRTQNSEKNSIGETDRQARQLGGQHEVEDTPMVTRIQPPPLLPRPPIQRQEEYTDQEQAGRTRLASNKRGRSQDRDGDGEEEPQSRYWRY